MIKESKDIDFIIAPAPYTKEDEEMVSAFFRKHKASKSKSNIKPANVKTKRKVVV